MSRWQRPDETAACSLIIFRNGGLLIIFFGEVSEILAALRRRRYGLYAVRDDYFLARENMLDDFNVVKLNDCLHVNSVFFADSAERFSVLDDMFDTAHRQNPQLLSRFDEPGAGQVVF